MENTFTSLSKYIPSKVLAQEYFSHLFFAFLFGEIMGRHDLYNNCCVSQRGRQAGKASGHWGSEIASHFRAMRECKKIKLIMVTLWAALDEQS